MVKDYIDVLNEKIYYIREDNGKQPVVFIHGYASSVSFLQSLIPLQRNYDIIALDLPGNGNSRTNSKLSIELYNDITKEFIKKLNLKDVILVGHSLGGATAAALSSWDNVKKGVLIAPFNPFLSKLVKRETTRKLLQPENLKEASESVKLLVQNKNRIFYFKNIAKTSIAFLALAQRTKISHKDLLFNQIINHDYLLGPLYNYYKNSSKKLVGISGKNDFFIPKETLHMLSKEFGIPFKYLNNCGHATIYEKPDGVNDFINYCL